MSITATNWRPLKKNTLRGFLDLMLRPSGLVIRECSLHEYDDGRRWIGLPSRPQLDTEGRQRIDPTTQKRLWVVEIKGTVERERFKAAALEAVDQLLRGAG
jgi:hypothetical protein